MDFVQPDDSFAQAKGLVRANGGELLSPIYVEKIAMRALREKKLGDESWFLELSGRYRVREMRARLKRHFEASLSQDELNKMAIDIDSRDRELSFKEAGLSPEWRHFLFVEEVRALVDLFSEEDFSFMASVVKPSSTHPYWAAQFMETVRVIGQDVVEAQKNPAECVVESLFFEECLHARKAFRHKVAELFGVEIVIKKERPKPPEPQQKKKLDKPPVAEALVSRVRRLETKLLGSKVLPDVMIEGIVRHSVNEKKEADRQWLIKQIENHKSLYEHQKKVEAGEIKKPLVKGAITRPQKRVPSTRMEIVLKFDTLPLFRPVPGKKSRLLFQIEAEDYVWDVSVSKKSVSRASKIFEAGVPFMGIVKGGLGEETSRGFEVSGAGLQVFEKVPKAPQDNE